MIKMEEVAQDSRGGGLQSDHRIATGRLARRDERSR